LRGNGTPYSDHEAATIRYLTGGVAPTSKPTDPTALLGTSVLITARNLTLPPHLRNLYDHLLENHYLECINGFNPEILDIFSRDVLARIKSRDATWETMVPARVAAAIKKRQLFGYTETPAA